MSLKDVRTLLNSWTADESVVQWFLSVWPLLEEILEAFSRATELPIFVFMNGEKLFQSSTITMPPFCRAMLSNDLTSERCVADGRRRAAKEEPEVGKGLQLCYAGMLNGRTEVNIGHLGTLVILFGSRRSIDPAAQARRRAVITKVASEDKSLAEALEGAERDSSDPIGGAGEIEIGEWGLMGAISAVVSQLFKVTLGFHWVAVNMAHELSNMMLASGLALKRVNERLANMIERQQDVDLRSILNTTESLLAEDRLGLYVVRNYLSHVSESRYRDAVQQKNELVDLRRVLLDLVELYRSLAAKKGIGFHVEPNIQVPHVFGVSEELQRAIHNVLNNAVKYSYRSLPDHLREIRIRSKVPYDPGFRESRFALTFENYGLGVFPDETVNVTLPGFRGRQAIAEVPVGSGIGLSEVKKIMAAHKGELKFRSREVHRGLKEEPTYLTQVDLVFPMRRERGARA